MPAEGAPPAAVARPFVHSPDHLARLIAFVVCFIALAGTARVLDRGFAGLGEDVSVLAVALPDSAGPLLVATLATVSALVVGVGVAGAWAGGRLRGALTAGASARWRPPPWAACRWWPSARAG